MSFSIILGWTRTINDNRMTAFTYEASQIIGDIDLQNSKHRVLSLALVATVAYCMITAFQYISNPAEKKFWASHPWAGIDGSKRLFSKTRAGIEAIWHTREIVEKGYQQVCTAPMAFKSRSKLSTISLFN